MKRLGSLGREGWWEPAPPDPPAQDSLPGPILQMLDKSPSQAQSLQHTGFLWQFSGSRARDPRGRTELGHLDTCPLQWVVMPPSLVTWHPPTWVCRPLLGHRRGSAMSVPELDKVGSSQGKLPVSGCEFPGSLCNSYSAQGQPRALCGLCLVQPRGYRSKPWMSPELTARSVKAGPAGHRGF